MFSSRLPRGLAPNDLAAAVTRARLAGRPPLDLTVSNPTTVGIAYPADMLAPLAHPAGLVYRPEPLGVPEAREAVSRDFARRGLHVDPGRIVLTASTSEAYAVLFKVWCDPGDEVLVPRPSYPLFEHLTMLDAVRAVPYDLAYHGTWTIERTSLERALSARTRIVLVVSPNNPTGSWLKAAERLWLDELCARRDLVLVADEVFADFPIAPDADAVSSVIARPAPAGAATGHTRGGPRALTVSLGGLSKSAGLPQLKVAWMAVDGPGAAVETALTRIELVCDTYLSVATPVQVGLGELLERATHIRGAIRARVRANHAALERLLGHGQLVTLLPAEGGWSAVIRVPATEPEDRLVVALVEQDGVLVHPGYFFDFAHEAFVVVSLLTPPDVLEEGVARLLRRFAS